MAPTIQAQHVVAVTIPTITVLFFTYLWYKKRSNSITRSRNDPGGGGGTSRKRTRHRNNATTATVTQAALSSSPAAHSVNSTSSPSVSPSTTHVEPRETFPEAMKNAMHKVMRDMETASAIPEICSDAEESQRRDSESSQTMVTSEIYEEVDAVTTGNNEAKKVQVSDSSSVANSSDEKCEDSDAVRDSTANGVNEESTKKTEAPAVSSHDDNESYVEDRRRPAESEKNSESVGSSTNNSSICCNTSRQFDCKGGTKNVETGDNLDVEMLKLESMRMSDSKSKPKQNGSNTKRQSHGLISPSSSTNDVMSNATNGAKSPKSSTLSQLASSAPSKTRKRRSRRRLKANQNGCANAGVDGSVCKSSGNDAAAETTTTTTMMMMMATTTTTTTSSKVATCDSNKNIDACGSRTNNKETKQSTNRKWTSGSEETYYTTRENDRLSCNLQETRSKCDRKVIENRRKDCDSGRDSANHSPVDTILDCQSVQFSDAHSEGSSDSGKGCSEGAVSPSPQTPAGGSSIAGDQNTILWYQFTIPQEHVGKLIGKHGTFINTIKASSNTRIYIKKHPASFKKKICALEGTQPDINKALELIRIRFPEETYPDLTLEEFPLAHQPIACPLRSDLIQLDLVELVNNDVVISSVVTAGHLFLQLPMHPSYRSLSILNMIMNQVYSSPEAPLVLKPAKDIVVAAPAMGGWYRAQIVAVDEESEMCEVRFLDYGGYLSLPTSCLRAVRADFMALPFQAIECFMADILPINDSWCEEAKLVLQGLTYGQMLRAQIRDYTPEGIPLVLLYIVYPSHTILVNSELVVRGFAYSTLPDDEQSEDYYVYS